MTNQNENPSCCSGKGGSTFMTVITSVIITVLVLGGGLYFWNKNQEEKVALEDKVKVLEEKVVNNEENKEEVKEVVEPVVEEKPDVKLPEDTFSADQNGDYYGLLTVTGYPEIQKQTQSFCDTATENCSEYNYVFFQITGTYSNALKDFADAQQGNSFIGEKIIGLGCKDGDILNYINDSEKYGMKEFSVNQTSSTKLFDSTSAKPVTITLERLPFFGGSGAPDCYMHFTNVTVY